MRESTQTEVEVEVEVEVELNWLCWLHIRCWRKYNMNPITAWIEI